MRKRIGIEIEVLEEAKFLLESGFTIRDAAYKIGISKSCLYHHLNVVLKDIDYSLYSEFRILMNDHAETRHIRGGESTKNKYLTLRKKGSL